MGGAVGVVIFDNCDEQVASRIQEFAIAKKGYGTANRRKPIWRLLGQCLDDVVLEFASRYRGWPSVELIVAAKGISPLAKAWREEADSIVDDDYIHAKKMLKECYDASLAVLADTLASLREIVFAALGHSPVVITVKGGGTRLLASSKSDRHYPFCELCWRYSEAAKSLTRDQLATFSPAQARDWHHSESMAGNNIGSMRFCALHDPSNPKLQYRTDVAYRAGFWRAISECKRRFAMARKARLAQLDAAIPMYARSILEFHAEGFSKAQIEQVTLLPPQEIQRAFQLFGSEAVRALRDAEVRFAVPDERLVRQAAYLLVHCDIRGLLDLESELPGLVLVGFRDVIQEIFEQRLAASTLEMVRLSRLGFAKTEIARRLGVSRQAVHNALGRELALAYVDFLELSESSLADDFDQRRFS